jgi:hypothetical protein
MTYLNNIPLPGLWFDVTIGTSVQLTFYTESWAKRAAESLQHTSLMITSSGPLVTVSGGIINIHQ